MSTPKRYEVYDVNTGKFLFEGTTKECAEHFGVSVNCFYQAAHRSQSVGHWKWLIEEIAKEKPKITLELTLTEEQARIVSIACEFYARIRLGQFNEILFRCFDVAPLPDDYYERKEQAERILLEARKHIYPELHGLGHSYGIGKFKDADLSFGVHQVLRHAMGVDRTPFSYHELPKCRRVDE